MVLNWDNFVPQSLVVTEGGVGGVATGWRKGHYQILQYTEWSLETKNYLAHNVNSAEAEKLDRK